MSIKVEKNYNFKLKFNAPILFKKEAILFKVLFYNDCFKVIEFKNQVLQMISCLATIIFRFLILLVKVLSSQ